MKHRKNFPLLSSDSESQELLRSQFRSFDSQSSSSSDSSQLIYKQISDSKLNKRDMLKLLKLEKAIEREEKILAKELRVLKHKSQIKSVQKKRTVKKQQKTPAHGKIQSEKKKLFITAIEQKYSEEEVDDELSKLLKNIQGLVNFRVKKKQGSRTYAFVDFVSKQKAADALEKLKKKRIFGQKITICYSQDDQRQNNRAHQINSGPKKCFQCNGKGHFAKECPLRLKQKQQLKDEDHNYFKAMKTSENTNYGQDSDQQQKFIKFESNAVKLEAEEVGVKRVIREKSGLNRLCQN